MSASNSSREEDRNSVATAKSASGAAAAAATKSSASAWIPKIKDQSQQQQKQQQPDGSKSSPPIASCTGVHDLSSDLVDMGSSDASSLTPAKGKNRSRNKKMNWKPLPVAIIRKDPNDRDRDIRAERPGRKYGPAGNAVPPAGKRSFANNNNTNGFRSSNNQSNHNNNHSVSSSNSSTPLVPASTSQNSHHSSTTNHQNNTSPPSAQSNSSEEKSSRSYSVSSNSSTSRHLQHHHQHQHPHHQQSNHQHQTPQPYDQTSSSSSSSHVSNSRGTEANIKTNNNNNIGNHSNHQNHPQTHGLQQQRSPLVNGSGPAQSSPASSAAATGGGNRITTGRPPVQTMPSNSAHFHRKQHPNSGPDHVPPFGRRSNNGNNSNSNNTGNRSSTTSGSGRATPNSLKDFSPEVQYYSVDYSNISPVDPNSMSHKNGLMSPVLTLPAGAVVMPAPSFAAGPAATSSLAPFYPPTVLPFAAIPVATNGLPGSQAPAGTATTVAVSTPAGLVPVSAFTLPSLPPTDAPDLKERIRNQIEYYFSEENLQGDIFIRRKMDPEGYLPISLIASFHRVQMLTTDFSLIIQSLEQSASVELSPDHVKARPRLNPLAWPIITESQTTPSSSSSSTPISFPVTTSSAPTTAAPVVPASASGNANNGSGSVGPAVGSSDASSSSSASSASINNASYNSNQMNGQVTVKKGESHLVDGKSSSSSPHLVSSGTCSDGVSSSGQDLAIESAAMKMQQIAVNDVSASGEQNSKGSGGKTPITSSSSSTSHATELSSASSDASAPHALHPDVPSFVPGQLYATDVRVSTSSDIKSSGSSHKV